MQLNQKYSKYLGMVFCVIAVNVFGVMATMGSVTNLVVIDATKHHLGDNAGNEGTFYSKSFVIPSAITAATIEFDFVTPYGPNLESPPQVSLNGAPLGSILPFFPPLIVSSCWVYNNDGSHDYNCGFHVALSATGNAHVGTNVFSIQNGRPDDDYYFTGILVKLVIPTIATGHVYCSCDGAPISGALVQIGGYSATTDNSGSYSITNVPSGNFPAIVSKTNFNTITNDLVIPSGLTTVTHNFTITPSPPILESVSASNGMLSFSWNSFSGFVYQVQYKTNLLSTNWIDLGNSIAASNTVLSVTNAIDSDEQRFFRVQQQ